jgi:hypothetical protein
MLIFQLIGNIKLSKATSGYLEIEHFKNADLHTGYFCYNCAYLSKIITAIVEDSGPDVNGKESEVIAPYGLCTCIIIYRRINLGYALSKLCLFYNISTVLFFILPKQIIEKENCSTL